MATTTWYVWSPITYDAEVDQKTGVTMKTSTAALGDKVTAKTLNVSDEQFQELIDAGSVRSYPFPDDMPPEYGGSPVQWLREKAKLAESLAATTGGSIYRGTPEELLTSALKDVSVDEDVNPDTSGSSLT